MKSMVFRIVLIIEERLKGMGVGSWLTETGNGGCQLVSIIEKTG